MRAFTRTAFLLAAVLPMQLFGQGLTIQSTGDVRLYGALGAVAGFAARLGGGNMHDIPTTTYLTGTKLRTEAGNTATIIDLDAERITSIDNKQKTFTSMTFAEMTEAMRQAQESAKQRAQQEKAERAKADEAKAEKGKTSKAPDDSLKLNYKMSVDRPGERAKIAGYDAERMFMTITIEAEAKKEGGDTEKVGDLVVLLDQWISNDAPQGATYKQFQKAYAQKAGRAFQTQTQALQGAFTADPRIKEGMEAAAKEMEKVPGVPLRSMMYMALVPPGTTFDRQLVLNDAKVASAKDDKSGKEEKPKGGGFKGLMGKIKTAAEDANKQQPAEDKSAPPKQATLMSVKDEVQSVTTGVPADIFTPPAGYREVKKN